MIAVDANVAVKWYLPEEGSDRAMSLLQNPVQLVAPSLIRVEVCAAITRRVRHKELAAGEGREHCNAWFEDLRADAVRLIPDEEIIAQAIELSLKISHSLQDCLYLAVAQSVDAPLVTADEPFFKRIKSHYPKSQLLHQWQLN